MGPHRCIDACSGQVGTCDVGSYSGVRGHTRVPKLSMLITAVHSELTLNTESHLRLQTSNLNNFTVCGLHFD